MRCLKFLFVRQGKSFVPAILSIAICFHAFAQSPAVPSPRSGYSLAYDEGRGVVVLFGGQDSANGRLGDTWEWRAGVWKKVPVSGPSVRMNTPMAYDADKKVIYLFGGRTDAGTENDLWSYDGKGWTKVGEAGADGPSPRQLSTMVYDKKQSSLVLFGGMDNSKKAVGDTWIWKDGRWSQLTGAGPSARSSHTMVFDEDLGAVVIYGGYIGGTASKECWELKDGIWHDLTGDGPPRIHASIAYDPGGKRLLLFGGFNERDRTNELWEYSKGRWSMLSLGTGERPGPRAEHRSVFIPGQGLFVFGGVVGPDANTRVRDNDIWVYNGGWQLFRP